MAQRKTYSFEGGRGSGFFVASGDRRTTNSQPLAIVMYDISDADDLNNFRGFLKQCGFLCAQDSVYFKRNYDQQDLSNVHRAVKSLESTYANSRSEYIDIRIVEVEPNYVYDEIICGDVDVL